jgi:hypothetical protein
MEDIAYTSTTGRSATPRQYHYGFSFEAIINARRLENFSRTLVRWTFPQAEIVSQYRLPTEAALSSAHGRIKGRAWSCQRKTTTERTKCSR